MEGNNWTILPLLRLVEDCIEKQIDYWFLLRERKAVPKIDCSDGRNLAVVPLGLHLAGPIDFRRVWKTTMVLLAVGIDGGEKRIWNADSDCQYPWRRWLVMMIRILPYAAAVKRCL